MIFWNLIPVSGAAGRLRVMYGRLALWGARVL